MCDSRDKACQDWYVRLRLKDKQISRYIPPSRSVLVFLRDVIMEIFGCPFL